MPNHLVPMDGKTFGKWTVLEHVKGIFWKCRCICGTERSVSGSALRNGKSNSCGCMNGFKHGLRHSPEWRCWQAMKQRCYRKKSIGYHNYGGRGIIVCERWRNSFEAFLQDMGRKPSPQHTIERIRNSGDYEPGNVRWATNVEQCRNKRTNVFLVFRGQIYVLTALAKHVGMARETLHRRIKRGMTVEQAIETPIRGHAQ